MDDTRRLPRPYLTAVAYWRLRPTHAWLLLAGCLSSPAWALGLSEWQALSALGDRAHAEAEIYHEAGELIDGGCFQLLYPGENAEFPPLNDARLSVVDTSGGLRLRLETSHAVAEPISQIRVRIRCGAPQTRDMVLFLSPRDYAAPRLVSPASKTEHSGSTGDTPPATAHTEIKRPLAGTESMVPSPGKTRRKPAVGKLKTTPGISAASAGPKLILSGDVDAEIVHRLRMSAELKHAPMDATQVTETQRGQLRRLFRSMMFLADLKEGRVDPATATDPASGGISGPPPAVTGPSSPSTPRSMALEMPKATPLPPLNRMRDTWPILLGLFLLASLLGLGLWLMRARRVHRELPASVEPMPSIRNISIKSESIEPMETMEPRAEPLETLLKHDTPAPAPAVSEFSLPASTGEAGVTLHSETPPFLASYRTILDLADSMMAFGLANDAADALKEYIDDHAEVAIEPWLKLLDVLRQSDKSIEYDVYSRKLKQHFNLEPPVWDSTVGTPGENEAGADGVAARDDEARFREAPSPLEAFPHVCNRLTFLWRQHDCETYLQHLLRDNRDGKRRGFPLIVVDDILFLIDLSVKLEEANPADGITFRPETFGTW